MFSYKLGVTIMKQKETNTLKTLHANKHVRQDILLFTHGRRLGFRENND